MRIFFLLGLFFLTTLNAQEELIVHVGSKAKKETVYLARLDGAYLKKLENILRFDLSFAGSTAVTPYNPELEKLSSEDNIERKENITGWLRAGIRATLKATVIGSELQLKLVDHRKQSIHTFPKVTLTRNLKQDRRKMHTLSDAVQKMLTGKEGIASTKLLYTVTKSAPGSKKEKGELWEMDYDGGNPHLIIKEDALIVTPTYIPPQSGFNSRNALYVSYVTGQPKIYAISLDKGSPQRATLLRGNQLMPALSWQRDQLAFISDASGNPDLFLQPFDPKKGANGKPRQIYAARHATEGTPTFSPNGKEIAFVSNKDGLPRIYRMTIPSEGQKQNEIKMHLVTKRRAECTAPNWSPDGKRIAYCSKVRGVRQIFVYDLEHQEEKQLTEGPIQKENPIFAQDSTHLVFNTSHQPATQLYLIDLRDRKSVKITRGPGVKRFPSWQSTLAR